MTIFDGKCLRKVKGEDEKNSGMEKDDGNNFSIVLLTIC
jgi:hypothetical protein